MKRLASKPKKRTMTVKKRRPPVRKRKQAEPETAVKLRDAIETLLEAVGKQSTEHE